MIHNLDAMNIMLCSSCCLPAFWTYAVAAFETAGVWLLCGGETWSYHEPVRPATSVLSVPAGKPAVRKNYTQGHFNQGQIDNAHASTSVVAGWTGLYKETKDRTEPGVQPWIFEIRV